MVLHQMALFTVLAAMVYCIFKNYIFSQQFLKLTINGLGFTIMEDGDLRYGRLELRADFLDPIPEGKEDKLPISVNNHQKKTNIV